MISRETYSRINNNVAVMIFSFILPHSPQSLSHSRSHSRSRSRSRPFLRFSRYRTLVSYVINRIYSNIYVYIYIYIYIYIDIYRYIHTHIYIRILRVLNRLLLHYSPLPLPLPFSLSLSHSHRLYKRSVRFSITKSGWKSDLADRRSRSVSPRSRRKRNRSRGEDTLRESRKDSRRLCKGRVSPERDSVGDLKLLSSSLDSLTKGIAEGNSD